MFLRLLFVLLVALNIAAGAWLLLGQDVAHVRAATDPGVPLLRLSAERAPSPAPAASSRLPAASMPAVAVSTASAAAVPSTAIVAPASAAPAASAATAGSSSVAAAVSVPTPAAVPSAASPATAPAPASEQAAVPAASRTASRAKPASYTCVALGPFADPAELRRARGALAAQTVRSRSRQEQATQSRGWWVYLPAQRSREQALAEAKRLGERGLKDYFVVGASGQPNTISLGLFKDPTNARKRRDEVAQAGFPAQMVERTDTVPAYWLDLVVADGPRLDWRSRVHGEGLALRATGCF